MAGVPAPDAPQLEEQLERCEISSLHHDSVFEEVSVEGAELCEQNAGGVMVKTARVLRSDLSGSRLSHLRVNDGLLGACNLANVAAPNAALTRVSIEDARLTGVALTDAQLADVTIRDCRVDLASFSRAHLERVSFEDCMLVQSDFMEARLSHVRFHRCDLTRADFRGARMTGCEFRRSGLEELQGVDSLRGSAMEWSDIVELAGVWAAALGIAVIDDD